MTDDFRLMIRRVVRHLRPRPRGLPQKWEPQVSDFNATKRSFDFGADRKCTVTDPAYWPDPAPTDITSLTQHVREFFDGDFRREYTICCAVPDASRRRLLTEAQRYLRNVRHAIEEWIPNRSQRPVFDDAPADIHAAEKELLKVIESLTEITAGPPPDTNSATVSTDKPKKVKKTSLSDREVLSLCKYLKKNLKRFPTHIACAREFCRQNGYDVEEAENKMRSAYRHRDQWS